MSNTGEYEYLLHVASGLHRGVKQTLPLGEYTLGRDTECDIILSDGSLSGTHLRIQLNEKTAIVAPEQGKVQVNGEFITGPVSVDLPANLTLGTVILELERLFELVTDEDLMQQEALSDAETEESIYTANDHRSSDLQGAKTVVDSNDFFSSAGWRLISSRIINVGMLALLCLAIFPIWLIVSSNFSGSDINHSSQQVPTKVAQIIDGLELTKYSKIGKYNQSLPIEIDLYGAQGRRGQTILARKLHDAKIEHTISTYDPFSLADKAHKVSNTLGYNVLVESGGAGEVVLSGFVDSDEDVVRLSRAFDKDVKGIHHVNVDRLVVGSIALAKAQELIARGGLSEYITPYREVNSIVVDGSIPNSAQDNWLVVKSNFDKLYAPFMHIIDQFGNQAGGVPVMAIRGVWAGLKPYVIFNDGGVYFEGTLLEGGWTIDRIREDRVVISRNNEVVDLTF